jgi:hypothetical protein
MKLNTVGTEVAFSALLQLLPTLYRPTGVVTHGRLET